MLRAQTWGLVRCRLLGKHIVPTPEEEEDQRGVSAVFVTGSSMTTPAVATACCGSGSYSSLRIGKSNRLA